MILLYVTLILMALFSLRPLEKNTSFNSDFIGKDTGNIIKGICIWIVFIRHISGYMYDIPALNNWDHLLFQLDVYVRQLLVVPFLFYSGYGVTLAIINKGTTYAESIPSKRVLPTLINFDIAVLIFVLMNFCMGLMPDLKTILLALTGWESVRNSNWYIFCILICYLISWASYKIAGISKRMLLWVWIGIALYIILIIPNKGSWWYDTIFSYGFGAVFAFYKDSFVELIKKHYFAMLAVSLAGFLLFYNLHDRFCISANICGVFLCCLLVLFTSKVTLKSSLLQWSGKHLFPLYIYQRLPMFVLANIAGGSFLNNHHYLYVIICLIITIVIAAIPRPDLSKSLSRRQR